MINIEHYYTLLGVSPNNSLKAIKQVYFDKTKEIHSQYATSHEAQEAFIALTEAYEVVSGKMQKKLKSKKFDYEAWQKEVRNKAAFYAEKKPEEFEKFINEEFNYQALVRIGKLIGGILSVFLICLILYMGFSYGNLVPAIFIVLLTSPITIHLILYALEVVKWGGFEEDGMMIFKNSIFQLFVVSLINLYLFFKIGLQTLITLPTYLLIFSVAIFIGFLLAHFGIRLKKKAQKFFYALGISPLVINLFLVLNFVGSSNPTQETYEFSQETRYMNRYARPESYSKKNSRIFLQGEGASKYGDYWGIQIFWDYTEMLNSDTIIYTFEEGLLGIKVMTAYEFIPYPIQKPLIEKKL